MTSVEIKNISFGRYLRAVRAKKGLSLDDISEQTRISVSVLSNIENEDYEKLPNSAYVKGFIQAYAEVLDADGETALNNYLEGLETFNTTFLPAYGFSKQNPRFWLYFTTSFGLMICIIVLTVYLMPDRESKNNSHAGNTAGALSGLQSSTNGISETRGEKQENAKLTLAVSAMEETWMKITIDHQPPNEYRLNPGDHVELQSSSGFKIQLGNAAAVRLMFNNQPVRINGKNGQMAEIQLP